MVRKACRGSWRRVRERQWGASGGSRVRTRCTPTGLCVCRASKVLGAAASSLGSHCQGSRCARGGLWTGKFPRRRYNRSTAEGHLHSPLRRGRPLCCSSVSTAARRLSQQTRMQPSKYTRLVVEWVGGGFGTAVGTAALGTSAARSGAGTRPQHAPQTSTSRTPPPHERTVISRGPLHFLAIRRRNLCFIFACVFLRFSRLTLSVLRGPLL